METEELKAILDNKFLELKQERHAVNANLNAVIGELQIGQQENQRAVVALEKNYSELKIIAENTNKILTEHLNSMDKLIRANHLEYKEFKRDYEASPAVTDWKVQSKELRDLKEDIDKVGIKFSKQNEEQNKKISQHEKWFYISFGVLFAGQALFKYIPMINDWVSKN